MSHSVVKIDTVLPYGLSRTTVLVLGLVLVAGLALVGKRLASAGTASGPAAAPLRVVGGANATTSAKLVVHVVGAVRRPGLYRLADGARVADAVRRAGGSTGRADLAAVNLALPLADGAQVIVPARIAPGDVGAAAGTGAPAVVRLSTASAADLDELPGIGPVTAEKIVSWRETHGPFRTVDELDAIPGIGPARVEQLRELVAP